MVVEIDTNLPRPRWENSVAFQWLVSHEMGTKFTVLKLVPRIPLLKRLRLRTSTVEPFLYRAHERFTSSAKPLCLGLLRTALSKLPERSVKAVCRQA